MHQKTVEGLRCGADRPALVAVVAIVLNVVVPDRDDGAVSSIPGDHAGPSHQAGVRGNQKAT
jgi:hypothetical protein